MYMNETETLRQKDIRETIEREINKRVPNDTAQAVQIIRKRRQQAKKSQASQEKAEKVAMASIIGMLSVPVLYILLGL